MSLIKGLVVGAGLFGAGLLVARLLRDDAPPFMWPAFLQPVAVAPPPAPRIGASPREQTILSARRLAALVREAELQELAADQERRRLAVEVVRQLHAAPRRPAARPEPGTLEHAFQGDVEIGLLDPHDGEEPVN